MSLTGLWWIGPGEHRVGSDPSAEIPLPAGAAPATLGTLEVSARDVLFRGPGGVTRVGSGDRGETPVLRHGSLALSVISTAGRFAVRVRDAQSEARRGFRGLDYFPIDPAWRLESHFVPHDPPRSLPIPNVLGGTDVERSPGSMCFELRGETHRLDPILEKGETDYCLLIYRTLNSQLSILNSV